MPLCDLAQSHPLAQKLLKFTHANVCRDDQHGVRDSGTGLILILHVALYKSSKEPKKRKTARCNGCFAF